MPSPVKEKVLMKKGFMHSAPSHSWRHMLRKKKKNLPTLPIFWGDVIGTKHFFFLGLRIHDFNSKVIFKIIKDSEDSFQEMNLGMKVLMHFQTYELCRLPGCSDQVLEMWMVWCLSAAGFFVGTDTPVKATMYPGHKLN